MIEIPLFIRPAGAGSEYGALGVWGSFDGDIPRDGKMETVMGSLEHQDRRFSFFRFGLGNRVDGCGGVLVARKVGPEGFPASWTAGLDTFTYLG